MEKIRCKCISLQPDVTAEPDPKVAKKYERCVAIKNLSQVTIKVVAYNTGDKNEIKQIRYFNDDQPPYDAIFYFPEPLDRIYIAVYNAGMEEEEFRVLVPNHHRISVVRSTYHYPDCPFRQETE